MPRYAVWFLFCICIIYTVIWPALAGYDRYCMSDDKSHVDGLCGDELSMVVQLVCDGKFSLPKKRSLDHKDSNKGQNKRKLTGVFGSSCRLGNNFRTNADMFPKFSPLQGALLGKRSALSYLGTNKRFFNYGRFHQGIVCECCYNVCSLDELAQYCLLDKKDV